MSAEALASGSIATGALETPGLNPIPQSELQAWAVGDTFGLRLPEYGHRPISSEGEMAVAKASQ